MSDKTTRTVLPEGTTRVRNVATGEVQVVMSDKTMSEWISVDDELPKNATCVIAATDNYAALGRLSVPARYDGVENVWYDVDQVDIDGCEQQILHVTHWMPMPPPPASMNLGQQVDL